MRTRAKTAYGVLEAVKRMILAEPKRIDMNHWIQTPALFGRPARGYPRCQTVGCVGGWVNVLTGTKDLNDETYARQVLGLNAEQADELFYPPDLLGEGSSGYGEPRLAQTKKHAQHVAAHITAFQRTHRVQLKAQKLG